MWGVTIMIAVGDLPNVLTWSEKADFAMLVRGMFGLCAVSVNLWLQITILYYVNMYIVGQAVHNTQKNYAQFHREVFDDDGSFDEEKWHEWHGPYMELCNMAVSKLGFTMAIVFIWTTRMLGEFRSVERLHRDVHSITSLHKLVGASVSDMVYEYKQTKNDETTTEYHVVALSWSSRLVIYIFVLVPKLLIVCILTFIGCRWLAATESFSDLILNALALEFVIGVDELIYENFAPQAMQDWVGNTKILHLAKQKGADDADGDKKEVIWAYVRSMLYMSAAFGWSYMYLQHIQQVIPGFTHDVQAHCGGWFLAYYQPPCPFGSDSESCFPYGPDHD